MEIVNKIGAYRNKEWYKRTTSAIKVITVHHDAIPHQVNKNDEDLLDQIMRTHQGHGWPGMAYHFWIGKTGKVYQVNDFTEITWHDKINDDSVAVCLNGYFHPDYNDKPTRQQLESLRLLLDELCTKHPEFPADQDDVWGHGERPNNATSCPGNNLLPYVMEYRNRNGQVNWDNGQTSDCEKQLEEMRESRNRWKEDYAKLEESSSLAISDRNKDIERLQATLAETTSAHTEATRKLNVIITKLEDRITDLEGQLIAKDKQLKTSAQHIAEKDLEIKVLKERLEALDKPLALITVWEFIKAKLRR